MNPFAWWKRQQAKRRLPKILKPDPQYRKRRLAQFSEERRERYWRNARLAGL